MPPFSNQPVPTEVVANYSHEVEQNTESLSEILKAVVSGSSKTIKQRPANDKMEHETIELALYKEVTDHHNEARVITDLANEGIEGLLDLAFSEIHSAISQADDGADAISTFNNETFGFSTELRSLLGERELEMYDNGEADRPDNYIEDLRDFVESNEPRLDTLEYRTPSGYATNPLDDNRLSGAEARTVVTLRLLNRNPSNFDLHDVEDHNKFRAWAERNVWPPDELMERYKLSLDFTDEIAAVAAPASEWDNPDEVETTRCSSCSDTFYEIVHDEHGKEIVTSSGDVAEIYSSDGGVINLRGEYTCGSCVTDVLNNPSTWVSIYSSSGPVKVQESNRIAVDLGAFGRDRPPLESVESVENEEVMEMLQSIDAPNHIATIELSGAPVDGNEFEMLLDRLRERRTIEELEGTDVMLFVDTSAFTTTCRLCFPTQNFEACRAAKEFVEQEVDA